MSQQVDIETLYAQHGQAIFGFLLNLSRSEDDTRDILQDLFVKIAAKPALLNGANNVRALLLKIAHNQAMDLFRKRATAERHCAVAKDESPVFAPCGDPDEAVFRLELSRALHDLPTEQCAVVHLKLWEGMTFEEIAETLNLPINTAASRYRYGIDKLRAALRPIYEEIN